MGLFNSWRAGKRAAAGPKRARRSRLSEKHICRFEQLESRQLLSANPIINLGVVYYENNVGDDSVPDLFEITFNGGAPGTQLTQLVIDTDKDGLGLSIGDCFFDIAPGGLGAYGSQPLSIVNSSGINSVTWTVADGGTRLVFNFVGFDAGEKLIFSIDVDEMGFLGPNSVAEGNEFEGSKLSAVFTAPHYQEAAGGDIFLDYYDSKLVGTGLNLPPDGYVPPGDSSQPDLTAGAIVRLTQTPLPSSIAGTVYEDFNGNNLRESGDVPLQNVQLTLLQLVDGQYVSTGRTTATDAAGHYRFDNLLPGTYRVVETQPAGYLSVGAAAGTVGGAVRGSVLSPDVIDGISLLGGEDSVNNDFAEFRGASLSGRVAADLNLNCALDSSDRLLAGVVLQLISADGSVLATTTTNSLGEYRFDGLAPGVYRVVEQQPSGYFDSCDLVGNLGGALDPPDAIGGIVLFSGSVGLHYDFLEIEPYRDQRVAELPYGIQKKVELGRALAMEPRLLLLDEPMAGMTVDEKADMARYILELREVHGLPMILIEHDMGVVMDLCDRILAMDYGRKIAEGPPEEIQNHPDVIRAYLGEEHGVAEEVAGGA